MGCFFNLNRQYAYIKMFLYNERLGVFNNMCLCMTREVCGSGLRSTVGWGKGFLPCLFLSFVSEMAQTVLDESGGQTTPCQKMSGLNCVAVKGFFSPSIFNPCEPKRSRNFKYQAAGELFIHTLFCWKILSGRQINKKTLFSVS